MPFLQTYYAPGHPEAFHHFTLTREKTDCPPRLQGRQLLSNSPQVMQQTSSRLGFRPAPHSQPFSACVPFCSFALLTLDRRSYAKGPFSGDVHITVLKMCFIQSPTTYQLCDCGQVVRSLKGSSGSSFLKWVSILISLGYGED